MRANAIIQCLTIRFKILGRQEAFEYYLFLEVGVDLKSQHHSMMTSRRLVEMTHQFGLIVLIAGLLPIGFRKSIEHGARSWPPRSCRDGRFSIAYRQLALLTGRCVLFLWLSPQAVAVDHL